MNNIQTDGIFDKVSAQLVATDTRLDAVMSLVRWYIIEKRLDIAPDIATSEFINTMHELGMPPLFQKLRVTTVINVPVTYEIDRVPTYADWSAIEKQLTARLSLGMSSHTLMASFPVGTEDGDFECIRAARVESGWETRAEVQSVTVI